MIDARLIDDMGWTLIHSVWQLTLLAVLFGFCDRVLFRRSANWRYAIGCASLLAMMIAPAATMFVLTSLSNEVNQVATVSQPEVVPIQLRGDQHPDGRPLRFLVDSNTLPARNANEKYSVADVNEVAVHVQRSLNDRTAWQRIAEAVQPMLANVVLVWVAGVVVLALRPLIGLYTICRLRRVGRGEASAEIVAMVMRLSERMCIRRPIEVAQSALLDVPAVNCSLRPLLRIPVSAISGLTTQALEAIIAHELAHLRRHDYIVNLLQTMIETVFFFHPAVWWVSHNLRKERENCCDDIALEICHDRATYIKALVEIEGLRGPPSQPVLAANGGLLLQRIRRIAGRDIAVSRVPWVGAVVVLMAMMVCFGLLLSPGQSHPVAEQPQNAPKHASGEETDLTPQIAATETKSIDRNGEIHGRLMENTTGNPVADVMVACAAVINDSLKGGGTRTLTDADGRYRLVVPSPGIYTVYIKSFDGLDNKTAAADDGLLVEAGKVTSSFLRLVPGREVAGKVVDSRGKPLEGRTVMSYSAARPQSLSGVLSTISLEDGSFKFYLPPGKAHVYSYHHLLNSDENPDGISLVGSVNLEVPLYNKVPALTLTLTEERGSFGSSKWLKNTTPGTRIVRHQNVANVTGRVVGNDDKPIEGAEVFRYDGPRVEVDADGDFVVEASRGTQFVMRAFEPEYRVWFGVPTAGDQLKIVLERKSPMTINYFRGREAAETIDELKPVWSEEQLGVKFGLAHRGQTRQFRLGERVPLAIFVRNVSDKRLEVSLGGEFLWNVPTVVDENGKSVKIEKAFLLGTVPLFRETLGPGEAFGLLHPGIGLGENPNPKKNWLPNWKAPVAGTYKLKFTHKIDIKGLANADRLRGMDFTGGPLEFEVVDDAISSELKDKTTSISRVEGLSGVPTPPAASRHSDSVRQLIAQLRSPEQTIRDAAAEKLRASYLPPSRKRWDALLAKTKPGDLKTEIWNRFDVSKEKIESGDGTGQVHREEYRLDDRWLFSGWFNNGDDSLREVKIVERFRHVWVKPASDFSGIWTTYFVNGRRSQQINYQNGKYHGTFATFYGNGSKWVVQNFLSHVADGEDSGYFPTGELMYRGVYRSGVQVGVWTWYGKDGSIRTRRDHGGKASGKNARKRVTRKAATIARYGGIMPRFDYESTTWNATHVVVVDGGEVMDGDFQIIETWKGDLAAAARLSIPELAVFKDVNTRKVSDWFRQRETNPRDVVTGRKMVLFLVKAGQGEDQWLSAMLHFDFRHHIDYSVVWVENQDAYAIEQPRNPGPNVIVPLDGGIAKLKSDVANLLILRSRFDKVMQRENGAEKAMALREFAISNSWHARHRAFAALGRCGPSAAPVLRGIVDDPEFVKYHGDAIEALAAALAEDGGSDLLKLLREETSFWKMRGPTLQVGWWNSDTDGVKQLQFRYGRLVAVLRSVEKRPFAEVKNAVEDLRDFWRSLPQLEDKSGLNEISENCDRILLRLSELSAGDR